MNRARLHNRVIPQLLGRPWWIGAAGAAVTAGYTLALLAAWQMGVSVGEWGYLGGGVGGFVAGSLRGTNVYEGFMDGLRAALLGVGVVGIVVGAFLFVSLYYLTGAGFFFWSPWVAVVVFLGFAPMSAFFGMFGGAIGVVLRRVVVPSRYNPPKYGPA